MYFVEHDVEGYIPARIVSQEPGGRRLVEGDVQGQLQQWWIPANAGVHRCDGVQLERAPDNLLNLQDYSYAALLHALRLRHHRQEPYTWIGPVLVSINPCKDLRSFSLEMVRRYMESSSACEDLVPHPFATVNRALEGGAPAAILVTGESGAGKTEAVKAMLSFLVQRQGTQNDHVCGVLVGSTQALEAFGNARTLQNSNSSRFGKLTEVLLDPATGRAKGAAVVPYMLEASRVTHHARGELNYHIFYVLAQALEKSSSIAPGEFWGRSDLLPSWLRTAKIASNAGLSSSPYIQASPSPHSIESLRCSPRFKQSASERMPFSARSQLQGASDTPPCVMAGCLEEIVMSLRSVGLSDDDILSAFRVVLAVSLLGNVSVSVAEDDSDDVTEPLLNGSVFGSPDAAAGKPRSHSSRAPAATVALGAVAELLSVPLSELQEFLTTRKTNAPRGGDCFVQPRTSREALTLRDSMAREIYTSLFGWLVRRVAAAAAPLDPAASGPQPPPSAPGASVEAPSYASDKHRVAILDIYGFEVCQTNGLEQMLINYCNERLQALFNVQMFAAEAREYAAEGLRSEVWAPLCQAHELIAISLFEGGEVAQRRFAGLFALVDDEARCRFNEGSGTALRSKMDAALNIHPGYKACRSASCFAVAHFAGDVVYDSRNFIETNVNAARPEILSFFMSGSTSPFLQSVVGTRMGRNGLEGTAAPRRQLFGRTVVQAFRSELDQLVSSFERDNTRCHYVRCLKPNNLLQPEQFDGGSVLRQCRYSGLLETVQIRQRGYPHRRPIPDFLHRYAPIFWPAELASRITKLPNRLRDLPPSDQLTWASLVAERAVKLGRLERDDVVPGHSKVFMRSDAFTLLEAQVAAMSLKIIPLQASFRPVTRRAAKL